MLSLLAIDVLRSRYAFNLPVYHHYVDITILHFDNKMNNWLIYLCHNTNMTELDTNCTYTPWCFFSCCWKWYLPASIRWVHHRLQFIVPMGDVVIFLKRLVNVDSSNMPRVTKDITWANWHICIIPKMIGTRITILHIENDGRWLAFNKHQTWTKQINTMYPDHNDLIKWKHFPRYWP